MNKRIFTLSILAAASTLLMSSCENLPLDCVRGKGPVVQETRTVNEFDRVLVDGCADIFLVQSSDIVSPTLEIVAQENIVEILRNDAAGCDCQFAWRCP